MRFEIVSLAVVTLLASSVSGSPEIYESLAGYSREEVDNFARANPAATGALPAPPPQSDTGWKLVNDFNHGYIAPKPTDMRGPCPGLNTLANHGYMPRSGVVTPQQIITAVQDGFNMKNDLATFITFGAMVVDGNQLTNLISIGPTNLPATGAGEKRAGGLNTHFFFEGDASTTRGDFYFGDNHSFNETLFQQLVTYAKKYGSGFYNNNVAKEFRYARIQDSIKRNPGFNFLTPRIFTAYAESIFPYRFFVDGRSILPAMNLTVARGFFQTNTFPEGFYRRAGAFGMADVTWDVVDLWSAHPMQPGVTVGKGNYVESTTDKGILGRICGIYKKHVTETVPILYPINSTTGAVKKNLQINLYNFWKALNTSGAPLESSCPQLFPYGK